MLALYRSGRQAAALESYREAQLLLAEELGLDPGPALQTMYQRVLRADPGLLSGPGRPAPALVLASDMPAPTDPSAVSTPSIPSAVPASESRSAATPSTAIRTTSPDRSPPDPHPRANRPSTRPPNSRPASPRSSAARLNWPRSGTCRPAALPSSVPSPVRPVSARPPSRCSGHGRWPTTSPTDSSI